MFEFLLRKPIVRPMYPDELDGVLNYRTRLERAGHCDVIDSSASPASKCLLVLDADRLGVPLRMHNVEVK